MIPEPWMDLAQCATTDPEAFFPHKGESAAAAIKVCTRCDAREACLRWALNKPQRDDHGVAGGTTAWDRRLMRKQSA